MCLNYICLVNQIRCPLIAFVDIQGWYIKLGSHIILQNGIIIGLVNWLVDIFNNVMLCELCVLCMFP